VKQPAATLRLGSEAALAGITGNMAELVDATDLTVFNLSILKVTLRLNAPKFREIFIKNTILSLVKVFDFERCRDSMGAIQKILKLFTNKKNVFCLKASRFLTYPFPTVPNSGVMDD